MLINIKEIFKSDLDPNSSNWWAKDKIDKLNFNFGQLENGGMLGPTGYAGINGESGIRGMQGLVGNQGPQGYQGLQGEAGYSVWKTNIGEDNITLLPTRMQSPEFSPVSVILGKEYNVDPNNVYNKEYDFSDPNKPNVAIYSNGNRSNLGLTYDGNVGSLVKYNFDGANKTLTIGEPGLLPGSIKTNINVNLENGEHSLYVKEDEALKISNNKVEAFVDSDFNQGLISKDSFKYGNNSAENQVLISTGTDGNVIWRSRFEIFGALPIGSIMSIRSSDFNSTNFHIGDTGLLIEGADGLLENPYGRGRENTPFEGWYLCNGQTWGDGVIEREVPNLNSFHFTIDGDGNDQDAVNNGGDDTHIIIGGAGFTMGATYNSSDDAYDIISNISNGADVQHIWNSTGGANLEQTRMIHLINLGEASLYWKSEQGSTIPTETIILSPPSDTSSAACQSTGTLTYSWTAVGGDWTDDQDVAGSTLYYNGSTAPGPKWYTKGNLSRRWTGTQWDMSSSGQAPCLSLAGYSLFYESDVRDLNWSTPPQTGYSSYLIDSTSLKLATYVKNLNGTFAAAGWYRAADPNQPAWYRKYWDGTSFGFSTTSNYVHYLGKLSPTQNSFNCSFPGSDIDIYYTATNSIIHSGTDDIKIQGLWNDQNTILVNKSWVSNNANDIGQYDMIVIRNQSAPSSAYPWSALIGVQNIAQIGTNSKISSAPTQCQF